MTEPDTANMLSCKLAYAFMTHNNKAVMDILNMPNVKDICKLNKISKKDRQTCLMYACSNDMPEEAIKLIEIYGDECRPAWSFRYAGRNHVETAFIMGCNACNTPWVNTRMYDVLTLMLDKFGKKCIPHDLNFVVQFAIMTRYSPVVIKLLDIVLPLDKSEFNPETIIVMPRECVWYADDPGKGMDALMCACKYGLSDVAIKLIKEGGILDSIERTNKYTHYETILMYACSHKLSQVAITLLEEYGVFYCKLLYVYKGRHALKYACEALDYPVIGKIVECLSNAHPLINGQMRKKILHTLLYTNTNTLTSLLFGLEHISQLLLAKKQLSDNSEHSNCITALENLIRQYKLV